MNVDLASRVDAEMPGLLKDLETLVKIPSISADLERQGDLLRSAETVLELFQEAGLSGGVVHAVAEDGTVGKPAVLAHRRVVENAPTVLLYAHHDVQPLGEVERWSRPPLELTVDGDRLFGRGAADDGAGIVTHLGALRALGDDLPVNVVVFIEGEEEIGSPSFSAFLHKYRSELESDVIIVADSGNWTVDIPALTSSLRGVVSCDVTVEVLEHAVHSGMFGGPVLDAVTLASRLIATLHDDRGDVAIAGLGGSDSADVDWPEADLRRDASVVDGYQLAGTGDLAARVWTKPAVSVIGFDARPVAQASNTIAPRCTFRLSLRTVPGADPAESLQALMGHVREHVPFGARLTVTPVEMGPGYEADLTTANVDRLRAALAEAWGCEPVSIGVGGSIPFISEFQSAFPGAEVLVTGVEDPQSNAHAEDESASLVVIQRATVAEALFLASLGTA